MDEQIIETWNIHSRINLYLLKAISEADLGVSLQGKGRTVGQLFAHMHNVRLMWLKAASPELLAGLEKLEGPDLAKDQLEKALRDSGKAIEALLRKGLKDGGRIKGFKPHAVGFLGYLISHESHHRGQVGWALKYSGTPLDKKTAFGLWEWGVR
jgi:uncharacterized damage-inducible protein DinB